MYLIQLTYRVPLIQLDQYLVEHRDYLESFYQKNQLLVSGPKNPRTGGVIIGLFSSLGEVEAFIAGDPFYINKLADYEITEFSAVKHHYCLIDLLKR